MGIAYKPQDSYFAKAKQLGYVARSAFKLLEIQRKFRVISRGAAVLDLGCAPGAWLQVACQHIGAPAEKGCVIGLDIKTCAVPGNFCAGHNVLTLKGDVFQCSPQALLRLLRSFQAADGGRGGRRVHAGSFSAVLSDMCPATSGAASTDVAGSLGLAERALALATGRVPLSVQRVWAGLPSSLPSEGILGHSLSRRQREWDALTMVSAPPGAGPSWRLGQESLSEGPEVEQQHLGPGFQCPGAQQGQQGSTGLEGPLDASGQEGREESIETGAGGPQVQAEAGRSVLRKGGSLVVKVLEGEGLQEFVRSCQGEFSSVSRFRPSATRSASREIYVVAKGFQG